MEQLGPATVSGKPLFLYGPPGNGKTTIAVRLEQIWDDAILVPFALFVEGNVIRVFDEITHQPAGPDAGEVGDRRWVRALDVTIQAQIMELLADCKAERGMATLLITHDLGIVAQYAERVAIMYAGRIMESAPVRELFAAPAHPYTRGLLACVPKLGEKRQRLTPIKGTIPTPGQLPEGCSFLDRCPEAFAPCRGELPPLREIRPGHQVRCWRAV